MLAVQRPIVDDTDRACPTPRQRLLANASNRTLGSNKVKI